MLRDFPGGTVVKTLCSQCRGPGLDPTCMPQLRSPPVATKTWCNKINKLIKYMLNKDINKKQIILTIQI